MWDRLETLATLDEPITLAPAWDDRSAPPPIDARHPGEEEEDFDEEVDDDEDDLDDDLDDEEDEDED
jgi:hypothetical protein